VLRIVCEAEVCCWGGGTRDGCWVWAEAAPDVPPRDDIEGGGGGTPAGCCGASRGLLLGGAPLGGGGGGCGGGGGGIAVGGAPADEDDLDAGSVERAVLRADWISK
jgi:hypothetical protein